MEAVQWVALVVVPKVVETVAVAREVGLAAGSVVAVAVAK